MSVDVFPPSGVVDAASSCQTGLFPTAVRAPADAGAVVDESQGGLGGRGGANSEEPGGWTGGWLWCRGH